MCQICKQEKPSYPGYKICKDCHKERVRQNYLKNKASRIAKMKIYQSTNRETYLAAQKGYYERNKSKWRVKKTRRILTGSYSQEEWKELCTRYGNVCLCCKKTKILTADHVIPVSKGGTNTIDNIQPLCRQCNSKKGIKTIDFR